MNILIADDENDIRNLVKISLEENGYTVLTAKTARKHGISLRHKTSTWQSLT